MNTSVNPPKRPPPRRKHWTRRSHRVIALAALVFLVLISVTGVLLNHADALGLSRAHVSNSLVQRIYGIEVPPVDGAYEAGGVVFATAGGFLLADGDVVVDSVGEIVGAIADENTVLVVTSRELVLLTRKLALIERTEHGLIAPPERLGDFFGYAAIEVHERHFMIDAETMALKEFQLGANPIVWFEPVKLDSEAASSMGQSVVDVTITWERVLVDLHSGRILPGVGRWLADLTAFCLLYLSVTGLVMWVRQKGGRNGIRKDVS